nr:MarR family winged helix-turn-helix transcriptional regulator [Sphingomonas sp. CDS-1]
MTEPTQSQVDQLTQAFGTFTRRFKVAEAAAAAENALNPLDAQTLIYVRDHPGCGLSDVARYLNVAITTMSSATTRLVRKALIERRRPAGDRRSVALSATEKGGNVVDDHIAAYRETSRWMLRALDREEREQLIRLTGKIASSEP